MAQCWKHPLGFSFVYNWVWVKAWLHCTKQTVFCDDKQPIKYLISSSQNANGWELWGS